MHSYMHPLPHYHNIQLLKWAAGEGSTDKALERERAFATLALARMLDPASIAALQAAVRQHVSVGFVRYVLL